jgi:hypothetical protein
MSAVVRRGFRGELHHVRHGSELIRIRSGETEVDLREVRARGEDGRGCCEEPVVCISVGLVSGRASDLPRDLNITGQPERQIALAYLHLAVIACRALEIAGQSECEQCDRSIDRSRLRPARGLRSGRWQDQPQCQGVSLLESVRRPAHRFDGCRSSVDQDSENGIPSDF